MALKTNTLKYEKLAVVILLAIVYLMLLPSVLFIRNTLEEEKKRHAAQGRVCI
jgi:type II secretory pathway pseudopilin PulG